MARRRREWSAMLSRRIGVAALLSCGCTSVTWRGQDGALRHLGFFAYRLDEFEHGARLTRTALGADLRLAGPSTGYGLGLHRTRCYVPEHIATSAEELPDAYAASLRWLPSPPRRSRRGVLYLRESVSIDTTVLSKVVVGADVETGPARGGVYVGYRLLEQAMGRATGPDAAQLHLTAEGDRHAIVLWTLQEKGD